MQEVDPGYSQVEAAAAENTAQRMALKIFSEHKPYLNFILARLNGKKMAIKMKVKTNKNISVVIFIKNMYILESKIK